jgi:hypothetical protein
MADTCSQVKLRGFRISLPEDIFLSHEQRLGGTVIIYSFLRSPLCSFRKHILSAFHVFLLRVPEEQTVPCP